MKIAMLTMTIMTLSVMAWGQDTVVYKPYSTHEGMSQNIFRNRAQSQDVHRGVSQPVNLGTTKTCYAQDGSVNIS